MSLTLGLLIPFLGTTLGSACVFLLKKEISPHVQKLLLGFASGVMVAASVWSLLIPAMEMAQGMEKFSFVPAAGDLYWESCFCWSWIGSSLICIWEASSRKAREAIFSGQPCWCWQ